MQIHVYKDNELAVIEIEGEVDLYNSPKLRQQLGAQINHGILKIIIDFAKVKYIDSSGLATLIEGYQKLNKLKGELKLCSMNKSIMDIFEVSRLNDVFAIYKSRKEAVDGFKKQ